nr:probable UDP-sugar transporter protein SLC35A4 [Procambarus clarkii]
MVVLPSSQVMAVHIEVKSVESEEVKASVGSRKEVTALLQPPEPLTLARKSDVRKSMILIIATLLMETGKQLSNFGLSRANNGQYPVPSCLLVLFTELTKFTIVLTCAAVMGVSVARWRFSVRFCVPAVCYFVTNFLYLLSITSVPPPIWMVLIQTRTLYTAASYRMMFGREVTQTQVLGCVLVVGSIPLARLAEINTSNTTITSAVLLNSQVCAVLSTAASIAVEILLKNDERSFCEQQVWLYMCGSLLATVALPLQTDVTTLPQLLESLLENHIMSLRVAAAVVSSALAGLCVPFIVKSLDSIAKDYLAALNNLLLSVVTAAVFPLHFTISWVFGVSLGVLLLGIWLYERKFIFKEP